MTENYLAADLPERVKAEISRMYADIEYLDESIAFLRSQFDRLVRSLREAMDIRGGL